ncbi:nicotinate phosphoribosyltransferase [Bacillus subtilis]
MTKYTYPATLLCDFYKVSHREQYPEGTELIYSTWTPRTSRVENIDQVVAFGFQGFIKKYLIDYFNENFFKRPKQDVVNEYKRVIKYTLQVDDPDGSHIESLHDLGYLPIKIKAVKEGTLIPIKVPMLTIENTVPEFFWITNYLETLMSNEIWQPTTSATLAYEYRKILDKFAMETVGNKLAVGFQGHDFSMRGMSSLESTKLSGAGHLLSFTGTDTIPAILYHEEFYNANIQNELVGSSIPATEHSVMCANGQDEYAVFKKLITETYPEGFVSIVSDTWDFWNVIDTVVRKLKGDILKRDGKVVIRPDSGDPVKIICGDPEAKDELVRKGLVEVLWDIFGGNVTDKGYKVLDPHIGAIYGDAITISRCKEICEKLAAKGFASVNVVFGIGSFTYQFNTRDTFGFAMKATYTVVNGEEHQIFKNPKTDDGTKKSQKGLVAVVNNGNDLSLVDELDRNEYKKLSNDDILEDVFINGKLLRNQTLSEIRELLLD